MKKFKYTAKFDVSASVEKQTFKNFESKASVEELQELRSLLPSDEVIKENDDLLYVSFNLAVAGLVNLNNHGIMPETAVKILGSFIHRPMNMEHDRSTNIAVITSTGLSTFPDNQMISAEKALKSKQPFNMAMGAVVWKICNPWMARYLEETNDPEDSWSYKRISTSWEVAFNSFSIARGSKNLFDAEIITDAEEVKRLSKYLTHFGGTGFDDNNKELYMVIGDDARGIGGGFTSNPAASVQGIFIPDVDECCEDKTKAAAPVLDEKQEKLEINEEITASSQNKISQTKIIPVMRINHMKKFTDIDNFVDAYSEAIAKNEAIATSDVRDFIKESLLKNAEGWQSKVVEQEQKAAAASKKVEELQAAMDIAKDDAKANADIVSTLKKELEDLKTKSEEIASRQVYDARMADLDSKYDMNDKVRKVIAKSILGKSDEDFAEWLSNEGEVILAGKEKKSPTLEESLNEAVATVTIPNADEPETPKIEKPLSVSTKKDAHGYTVSFN